MKRMIVSLWAVVTVVCAAMAQPIASPADQSANFSAVTNGQIASPAGNDPTDACTSIMVSKGASVDGSVITSHTCDGKYRTWVSVEPALDHKRGDVHLVRTGTMKTASEHDMTGVKVVGTIPEARHTYAYVNTAYPCLNEKRLAMGETTFGGPDTLKSDNGIFTIEELERIALQRCTKAREAVLLMGRFAEEHGYIDGGECLTVADPDEVWQFEIVGPGKGRKGAVWVAKRVPDGHVAVSANVPRIGVLEADQENFLCSDNVVQTALDLGLWDGEGEFKFWKVYNCTYGRGRNYRERDWFILNALAPSLGLTQEMDELPFSVVPDEKVDVRKVMELFRENYEGSELSMTKGVMIAPDKISPIANPWPTTATRQTLVNMAPGCIEFTRTVAVAWCAYSTVIQLRSDLPEEVGGVCWFSVDNPGESPRIPIFSGTTSLPAAFAHCGQNDYNPNYVLWQYRKANKLATVSWQLTKKRVIDSVLDMENMAFEGLDGLMGGATAEELNAYTAKIHSESVRRWAEMEAEFWLKFGSGF